MTSASGAPRYGYFGFFRHLVLQQGIGQQPLEPPVLGLQLLEALVTPGFELPNPHIIHARAASYINDDHPERYLDLAVGQTLRVANEAGIKSMAMPAIGTGVFKFPPELAAEILVKALLSRAAEHPEITLVRICVGDVPMKAVFQNALDAARDSQVRN